MTNLQKAAIEALETLRQAAASGFRLSPQAAENSAALLVAALRQQGLHK